MQARKKIQHKKTAPTKAHKKSRKTSRSKLPKRIKSPLELSKLVANKGDMIVQSQGIYRGRGRYHGKKVIYYTIISKKHISRFTKRLAARKRHHPRSIRVDEKRKALPLGKRVVVAPDTGKIIKVYYEYRLNRADRPKKTL